MVNFVVVSDYYQYVALAFATMFIIPQLKLGYKNRSLKEVSTASMIMIIIASGLWGYYMFELEAVYFLIPTIFVGITGVLGLIMQITFYYERVNEHYKSFDKPSSPPLTINCPHCNGENNV